MSRPRVRDLIRRRGGVVSGAMIEPTREQTRVAPCTPVPRAAALTIRCGVCAVYGWRAHAAPSLLRLRRECKLEGALILARRGVSSAVFRILCFCRAMCWLREAGLRSAGARGFERAWRRVGRDPFAVEPPVPLVRGTAHASPATVCEHVRRECTTCAHTGRDGCVRVRLSVCDA